MSNWYKPFLSIVFLLLSLYAASSQDYVNIAAIGSNNETTWNATRNQDAQVACQSLIDGGTIGNEESNCGPYTPTTITNVTSPSGEAGPIEYLWLASTSGCPTSIGQQIPDAQGASLTLGTITQTTYVVRWSRSVGCIDWVASNCIVKTVQPCGSEPSTYCHANGLQPWKEWIANVALADLNNPSGKSSSGYENNTSIAANLVGGTSYQLSITPGYSYEQRKEQVYVWIDYNQNKSFADSGELVLSMLALEGELGTIATAVSKKISIPTSAKKGTTRMRVAIKQIASNDPCGNFVQGEVEDYSVSIR